MTYTYVILEVSKETFSEVEKALRAAEIYDHAFEGSDKGLVIDMHGLALRMETESKKEKGIPSFKYIMENGATVIVTASTQKEADTFVNMEKVVSVYELHREVHSVDCGGSPIPVDEPVFVLRAQDETAPSVVLHWMECNQQIPEAKMKDAFSIVTRMLKYPKRKKPD